jgi:colanic acid/amylovoran biosynthesis protein
MPVPCPAGARNGPSPHADEGSATLAADDSRWPPQSRRDRGKIESACLLGVTQDTGNYGVRALLSGAVESLSRANPNARICLLDYGREPATWTERTADGEKSISLINLRFSWRLHLPNNVFRLLFLAAVLRLLPSAGLRRRLTANPWLRRIQEIQCYFSLAGGDSFSDIYGLRRLLYVTLPQFLVLGLGKPLVLLPQTYGPFKRATARWLARGIFRRAALIYSRDAEGVATVGRLVPHRRDEVRVATDLGFAMEPEPVAPEVMARIEECRRLGPVVGLNISSLLHMGGYSQDNMFGLKRPYPLVIRAVLDFIVKELQAVVLLTPHVYGGSGEEESEDALCRRLLPEFEKDHGGRVVFIDRVFNHRQVKFLIGKCDVFSGARMHACIAAASQAVPTVALAYSDKFAGVLNLVGPGARVVDLRQADHPQVCLAIREVFDSRVEYRHQLERRMLVLKADLGSIFTSEVPPRNGPNDPPVL